MKLRIDTTGVSFTCTRAPEQRVNFDTGRPRVDKATGVPPVARPSHGPRRIGR